MDRRGEMDVDCDKEMLRLGWLRELDVGGVVGAEVRVAYLAPIGKLAGVLIGCFAGMEVRKALIGQGS